MGLHKVGALAWPLAPTLLSGSPSPPPHKGILVTDCGAMEAYERSHQAYLQIQYGDTGQLINALNQMLGENQYGLKTRGSNRWVISTERKLSDICEQSVKELDDLYPDEVAMHSREIYAESTTVHVVTTNPRSMG
ncbi:hypothetical protein QBC40DRAFT_348359 [Triangularia verruculosa]|uniref:Uncharacterized protein n=1 Tax=Triangularia verruculosa TaxID=2587418 RepID=A0AAN6XLN2_9PEZI|nr:hypothetical protein QBC40DRAFT_348359 [Triangularia verruculosa]